MVKLKNTSNEIINLFSAGIFQSFMSRNNLNLPQFNAAMVLLFQRGIPFDTKFTPSNGRDPAEFVLTVFLTPKITVDFSFSDFNLSQS